MNTKSIQFIKTSLPGLLLVEPPVYEDSRGFFMETYHKKKYAQGGIGKVFVQDNHAHSTRGVVRGLHYQLRKAQAKLVMVTNGEVFDVAVDIRRDSPTFAQWFGINLSANIPRQIFIPEGFAHGYCVLSNTADVLYKCTDFYDPGDEYGIFWEDSDISIDWPIKKTVVSDKDSSNPNPKDIHQNMLPRQTINRL